MRKARDHNHMLSMVDQAVPSEDSFTGAMKRLRAACEQHAKKKPVRKDGSKQGSVECPECGDSVLYTIGRTGGLAAKCQSMRCIGIV